MLVLTRKPGERILIGEGPDQIIIEVRKIVSENRVSIGVKAPQVVPISRDEHKEKQSEHHNPR